MVQNKQRRQPPVNRIARPSTKIYRGEDKHSKSVKVFIVFFFICILGILMLFHIGLNTDFCAKHFGYDSAITKLFDKMSSKNSEKSEADFSLPLLSRRKNILLLGVDASETPNDLWSGTRTDTIILLNVDPRSKSVNAISIPRDSKVFLPGDAGIQKINAAHAIGGVGMTVRTVEHTLGVKVDKYIMVHDDAVKAIVEALGGVDVYVEKNMHYNDWAGHLHINLTKGYNHLTPEQAVGYLRFRHDPMGDIGRTQRQQWFLRGILNELKKPETVSKIPDIVGVARKYIKTDMSMYDLTQFALMMKGLDMDKIEVAVLPGAPNKHGYISYWILDPDKTQEVVNRLIYRRKPAQEISNPTASIIYADGNISEAQDIISGLKQEGVTIACETRVSKVHSQFIAHSPKVTSEYFSKLRKSVSQLEKFQFVYEPLVYMCAETDFTIVVSSK